MPTRVRREALTRAVQANEMTQRAKWYLLVASCRHLLTGCIALAMPSTFKSTSFIPILEAAPLWFWACIFVGAGLACGTAAVTGHEAVARLGMAWSATSTLVVGIALLMSVFSGQLASPTGPILWLAVAFKDFVVCAQPIRSPFEGLAQRLAEKQQTK